MKKTIAFLMLFVGLGVAAASGSRNGESHAAYRIALTELPGVETSFVEVEAQATGIEEEEEQLREDVFQIQAAWRAEDDAERTLAEEEGREFVAPEREDPFTARREDLAARSADVMQRYDELAERKATLEAASLPEPAQRLSEWFAVGGVGWIVGLVLIAAGAVLARRQIEAENRGETMGSDEDSVDFLVNLQKVQERLEKLSEDIAELPMDDDAPAARQFIDDTFDELIMPIVDARGRYSARHGVGVFASYFGAFAGGERNLSRTWSALTDGHAEEARASLVKARDAFAEAEDAWNEAEAKG